MSEIKTAVYMRLHLRWVLGSSPHIQLNTLQLLIVLPFCSSSGTRKEPSLSETAPSHEQQCKTPP